MRTPLRSIGIGFALVACGIMVANLLTGTLTPESRLMFPVWVVACLVPAYWYGHRLGVVSFAPWEILGTAAAVLAAVAIVELWSVIRPLSAVALALVVCFFLLVRRRWVGKSPRRRP